MIMYVYIYLESIQAKIAQQESDYNDALNQYDGPICEQESKDLIQEIAMSSSEWRVFVTKVVASAWESLVTDSKDKSIASSWDGTGLNLHVDGINDRKWHVKMLEKYDGIIAKDDDIDTDLNVESRGYQRLRAITKLNNPKTAIPPYKHPKDKGNDDGDDDNSEILKEFLEETSDDETDISDDDNIEIDMDNNQQINKKKREKQD